MVHDESSLKQPFSEPLSFGLVTARLSCAALFYAAKVFEHFLPCKTAAGSVGTKYPFIAQLRWRTIAGGRGRLDRRTYLGPYERHFR